jgi:OmpA-OmpF porin, OOP family
MQKKYIFSILLLVLAHAAQSQYTLSFKKSADRFFAEGDYYSAAKYYEKYLGETDAKGKDNEGFRPYVLQYKSGKGVGSLTTDEQSIIYRLAESYRQTNNYPMAEKWYGEAIHFDTANYPLAKFYFAESLRANEKLDSAENVYQDFIAGYTKHDAYKQKAQRALQDLDFMYAQMSSQQPKRYAIEKANATINTAGAHYAPAFASADELVFTSSGHGANNEKTKFGNELISWKANSIRKIELGAAAPMQQGVASFSADGNMVYFTRWQKANGQKTAAIYRSKRVNGQWLAAEKLNQQVNENNYLSQQPFVTADGQYLYFSSNRPGGIGGNDLWVAQLDANGEPTAATNLGNTINTVDDEEAPFYHAPTHSLVFASNGRVGMGGFDLFSSNNQAGSWSVPVNAGIPINSNRDDIYFASKSKKYVFDEAWMSSDRSSTCCLELYELKKRKINKQLSGMVQDKTNQAPLAGVLVMVKDANGNVIANGNTNANGIYQFELPDYLPLQMALNKEAYETAEASFALPIDVEADSNQLTVVYLNPKPKAPVEVAVEDVTKTPPYVYFEYDKANLRANEITNLNNWIALLEKDPATKIDLSGHTDSRGSDEYNLKLSQKRVVAVRDYLIANGVDAARITFNALGKKALAATDKNEDGTVNEQAMQNNRRVELKLIK